MKAKLASISILVVLVLLVPLLETGSAARPLGSVSGKGMIYPDSTNGLIGCFFEFRLRLSTLESMPRGTFDCRLVDGSQTIWFLDSIQVTGATVSGNTVYIDGTALMFENGSSSGTTVTFTATAADGDTGDVFSIIINGIHYENWWPTAQHVVVTIRVH